MKRRPLVKIRERDSLVLRVRDVNTSLRFDTVVLRLQSERVKQCKAENDDTVIDLFPAPTMEPIGGTAPPQPGHCCMVIEPTDLNERKSQFQARDINIQVGPCPRWGAHGNGISLYIDCMLELRYDAARIPLAASRLPEREEADS